MIIVNINNIKSINPDITIKAIVKSFTQLIGINIDNNINLIINNVLKFNLHYQVKKYRKQY